MKRTSFEIDVNSSNKKLHIQTCAQEETIERLILIPPLVGASAIQQILYCKHFLKPGHANKLMSYDYSGHNRSPLGTMFSLSVSIEETREAILYAISESQKEGLPLHIMGTCYSTIPILISLQQLEWPEAVSSLTIYNGLTRMDKILTPENFLPFLAQENLNFKNAAELLSFLRNQADNTAQNSHEGIISAMIKFLTYKFPELTGVISSESFGELCYSRSEIIKTLIEFIEFGKLDIHVPETLACYFVFGKEDRILNLDNTEGENFNINEIMQLAPGAIIRGFKVDHYGKGEGHTDSLESIYQFVKSMEVETVSEPSFHDVSRLFRTKFLLQDCYLQRMSNMV